MFYYGGETRAILSPVVSTRKVLGIERVKMKPIITDNLDNELDVDFTAGIRYALRQCYNAGMTEVYKTLVAKMYDGQNYQLATKKG